MFHILFSIVGSVSNSLVVNNDDFWDYDHQVDLEAFTTGCLYNKLTDQSNHIVTSIGDHKDQVSLNH